MTYLHCEKGTRAPGTVPVPSVSIETTKYSPNGLPTEAPPSL